MKHFWASFCSPPRCRNGLDRGSQLSLFNTGIGHQDGHLATKFFPGEVGVLKFRIADMSATYEKTSERGVRAYLLRRREHYLATFCSFSKGRCLLCRLFRYIVFHWFFAI